jgi:ribosomal protein L15E
MVERRTFLIEAWPEADIVLRLLGPFAVQGAEILTLEAEQGAACTRVRIEARGLPADTALHLVERLRAMPAVQAVGLGWRAAAAA